MPAPRRPRPVPRGIDPNNPDRVLTKHEVEFLTSMGFETFRRHYPHLIVELSPRRIGVRAGEVYAIARSSARAPPPR
jgi:hypothetical protein